MMYMYILKLLKNSKSKMVLLNKLPDPNTMYLVFLAKIMGDKHKEKLIFATFNICMLILS